MRWRLCRSGARLGISTDWKSVVQLTPTETVLPQPRAGILPELRLGFGKLQKAVELRAVLLHHFLTAFP